MRLLDNFLSSPVRYIAGPDQTPRMQKLGVWERITHCCDERFHVSLAHQNTEVLNSALRNARRLTPLEAQSSALLESVRRFEKSGQLGKLLSLDQSRPGVQRLAAQVQELSSRLLAARLGLTAEELQTAPGLAELARKDRIYNYMARYGEGCQFLNGEVQIKCGGQMVGWSAVPEGLKRPRDRTAGEPWPYDASGLCDRNMDVWPGNAIQPFFYADPAEWGGGYVMSLCTSTLPAPRLMAGDHTWIRLYNPNGGRRPGEGAIYAVGLYRPGKGPGVNPMEAPLRVKPGTVRLDYSEFWGEPITELAFRITQDQFEAIRDQIEEDHAAGGVPFQLVERNCTRYALELARQADVTIDAHTDFARLLLPPRIASVAQKIFNSFPRFVQSFILSVTGLFWNLVQVKLGATQVDPQVPSSHPNRVPSFASLGEAVRTAGSRPQALPTPWRLGQEITNRIRAQRAERTSQLYQELARAIAAGDLPEQARLRQEIVDTRYWLPPENRGIRRPPSPIAGSRDSLAELDQPVSRPLLRRVAS